MKIIPITIAFINLFSCFGSALYVLKEIIHNKDVSILFCALMLTLAFISFSLCTETYKNIKNELQQK